MQTTWRPLTLVISFFRLRLTKQAQDQLEAAEKKSPKHTDDELSEASSSEDENGNSNGAPRPKRRRWVSVDYLKKMKK